VRLTDINNQWSSARLVVVGIFKPSNPYMSMPIIFNNRDLRLLAGYGPHDIPSIQIEIKDPQKNARKVAERIYHSLKPSIAVIEGNAQCRNICAEAIVLGFKNDMASRSVFSRMLPLAQGDSAAAFGLNGVILSPSLATKYGAGVGDTLNVAWHGKYDTAFTVAKFTVTAVAAATAMVPQNCLFVNEHDFYHWYYMTLPAAPSAAAKAAFPGISSPFYKALAPEYTLMKQCATTQELQNEFRELSRQRVRGVVVSVYGGRAQPDKRDCWADSVLHHPHWYHQHSAHDNTRADSRNRHNKGDWYAEERRSFHVYIRNCIPFTLLIADWYNIGISCNVGPIHNTNRCR
jgi:hypothetical protein